MSSAGVLFLFLALGASGVFSPLFITPARPELFTPELVSPMVPMAALVDFVNFKMKDAVVDMYSKADLVEQLWFPSSQIILLDIVTLVCLLAVPSMCAWVVSSSGASEANGAIMRTAMKALAFKK